MEITVVTLVEEQMSPWKGYGNSGTGRIEWWKAMEGARVMTRGFEDLVAKLDDKVVMEVLVRCWSDGDVVVRSW
ncbi:hypothetical protein Tco_1421069 [Tanacetum coccineum]